jgi:putative membrane protein
MIANIGNEAGAWAWLWPLWFILFWFGIFALFRFVFWRRGHHWHGDSAEQVLAERYARGEISEDEFRQRRDVLRRR